MVTPLIMLGLLIVPLLLLTGAGRVVGHALLDVRSCACLGLALVFGFAGVGHFIQTLPMAEMLPDWVPLPIPIVYLTGVLELVIAMAIVIPRFRVTAGWAIVVMLILFLPVNVHAAVHHVGLGGHVWGPVYLLIRIPLQLTLLGWTWFFAIRPSANVAVTFACMETLKLPPEEIARQILDLDRWPEFTGYAFLPGIQAAEFERQTPEIVGTRIRVTNTDGSKHVEEIVVWDLPNRLQLHMTDFSPPLSKLATGFDENWEFNRDNDTTRVARSFEMHPRSAFARVCLCLIAVFLKKAVAAHLRQIRAMN